MNGFAELGHAATCAGVWLGHWWRKKMGSICWRDLCMAY